MCVCVCQMIAKSSKAQAQDIDGPIGAKRMGFLQETPLHFFQRNIFAKFAPHSSSPWQSCTVGFAWSTAGFTAVEDHINMEDDTLRVTWRRAEMFAAELKTCTVRLVSRSWKPSKKLDRRRYQRSWGVAESFCRFEGHNSSDSIRGTRRRMTMSLSTILCWCALYLSYLVISIYRHCLWRSVAVISPVDSHVSFVLPRYSKIF